MRQSVLAGALIAGVFAAGVFLLTGEHTDSTGDESLTETFVTYTENRETLLRTPAGHSCAFHFDQDAPTKVEKGQVRILTVKPPTTLYSTCEIWLRAGE